ncbi:MAG TPA: hypothetical protein PLD62_10015 [Candidatus Cloacimonadota bacterium]|nr:hypothetical protein [Candidatus Cloacimonadota bacterium]
MKKTGLVLLILLLAGVIYSYSILEGQSGNEIGIYDGRSAAMGNTGVTNGQRLFDSFLNPANLANLTAKTGFQGNFDLFQVDEKRSLPMYNSFDAYSGEATYADNLNYFGYGSLGIYHNLQLSQFLLAGGLFYHPAVSFDADYFEEVRNNQNSDDDGYPPIIAKNYIESEGMISSFDAKIAFKYKDFISAGLSVSRLQGDSKWEKKIVWQENAYEMVLADTLYDFHKKINRDYEAMQIDLGANFKVNDRLQIGVSFQPKTDFDVSSIEQEEYNYYAELDSTEVLAWDDSTDYAEYLLPSRLRGGLCYQPQNIMRTYFNVEIERVGWSDVNKLYDDEFNYYLGIEHVLPTNIPIRLGFSFVTSYGMHEYDGVIYADKITIPTFTVGSGFRFLDRFKMDIGLQYSNREYEALDLFQDTYYDHEDLWANYQYINLQDRGWDNPDTVKEAILGLKASVSFDW